MPEPKTMRLPVMPIRGTAEWDAWRAKISAALRGRPKPPRTVQHRANLSTAKRKNPCSPAVLAANQARRGSRWSHTPEAIEKIRIAVNARIPKPEWSVRAGIRKSEKARERFWTRLDKSSDCWLWTGATDKDGYGDTHYVGIGKKAHRVAYALSIGPIPSGGCVLHRCDTPRCCNPEHLYLGTPADNARDREERQRGRWSKQSR